jgi:transcriptional regulator with GAF, ATPase, and Fis domain
MKTKNTDGDALVTSPQSSTNKWHSDPRIQALNELILVLLSQIESLKADPPRKANRPNCNLPEEVRRFEIGLIFTALNLTQGHQTRAAKLLGLNPTTLNSKIKRLNIQWPALLHSAAWSQSQSGMFQVQPEQSSLRAV